MSKAGYSAAAGAGKVAALFGLKEVTGRHALHTAVDAGLIDHGPARGRTAPRINPEWAATICLIILCTTELTTTTGRSPNVVKRVTHMKAGGDSAVFLMGDDQTPVESGSFLDALTQAIEGTVDPLKGPAVGFGLQFCRGEVRAWAEWELIKERVYFGVRALPEDGLIQEVRIGRSVISELHRIAVPEETTPTQFAPESAAVTSHFPPEFRRDVNREVPVVYAQHEHQDSGVEVKNQPDSGADSPTSNHRGKGRSSKYVRNPRNRCTQVAQP